MIFEGNDDDDDCKSRESMFETFAGLRFNSDDELRCFFFAQ